MKIISYLNILIIYLYLSLNNFVNCYNIKNNFVLNKVSKINKNSSLTRLNSNTNSNTNTNTNIKFVDNNILKNKLFGFLNLIRYKNIFPTVYLFLTGAFIVNPNVSNLLLNIKRLSYTLCTTLSIMMSNMVVNDLFDIRLDKINNPLRPLITGSIKIKEAILLLITLLSFTEYINIYFLPKEIQNIIHFTELYTLVYTPILKKIPLIKNLSCALIVSLSIYTGALSAGISKNLKILYQIISLVFLGSFYNEILLDIHDHEGDTRNNIRTISTLFGKRVALSISEFILSVNINYNVLLLSVYGDIFYAFLFFLLSIPISVDLLKIYESNYKKENIRKAVNTSSAQLLFMLSLFILLSIK